MDIKKSRKILVLGSGMMVEPLIDYLLNREENSITLASDILDAAQSISSRKIRCKPEKVDVIKETEKLAALVKDSDLVISFIPAFLHLYVAKQCLNYNKSMVTASYISEEMKSLDSDVKAKNLVFMNEIGLDPGIDHIVTHKVIDECQTEGSKIISYESWCGALPSPDAIDNPLLYKFSWSPRGALNALKNSVVFLQDGREIEIPEEKVLLSTVNKIFHPCFNFEGYYNRNSLKYRDVYHLHDAETIIRGTLRFKGFSYIIQGFKYLGLFDSVDILQSELNWRCYLNSQIEKEITKIESIRNKYGQALRIDIPDLCEDDFKLYQNLGFFVLSSLPSEHLKDEIFGLTNKFIEMVHYLGLANSNLWV